MPPDSDAFTVRAGVQKLSADSAIRRVPDRRLVHRQFVRMACRHPFRSCFIDPQRPKPILNYGETLVGVKMLLKRLRPLLKDEPMVGVWLPPSAGGAIANIASPASARRRST